MKKLRIFLPVLVAVSVVTTLYAANAERLNWTVIFIPLGIAILISLIFMGLFALHPKTSRMMPFIAAVFTFTVLMWYIITPYAGIALLVLSVAAVFFKKLNTKRIEEIMSLSVILAIVISIVFGIVTNLGVVNTVSGKTPIVPSQEKLPNIYIIVPDRMPSFDSMFSIGINTTDFEIELYKDSFYIKSDQKSDDEYTPDTKGVNTTRTMRFMASFLNDGKAIPLRISYKECRQLIGGPSVIEALHEKGYCFYNIGSWFTETQTIYTADYNLRFPGGNWFTAIFQGEFNTAFWRRTIFSGLDFRVYLPQAKMNQTEGLRHVWQAEELITLSKSNTQQCVFAHIILPHEPYVWNAEGNLQFGSGLSEQEKYVEQIRFTCGYLLGIVNGIILNDPDAIIIIQSDEGMGYTDYELSKQLTSDQWNGVFTAWRIPGADREELAALKHTGILRWVLDNLK